MKKVYYIALLAIIMIVCLQGYNVHLQYLNYKLECVDKINDVLVQSVDEEYHNRAKSKKGGITKEKQHIKYKIFHSFNQIPREIKKEPFFNLRTLNIGSLKKKGIISSTSDALTLLEQDQIEKEGKPLNLTNLNEIVSRRMEAKIERSVFLLDKNKKIIKAEGVKKVPSSWGLLKICSSKFSQSPICKSCYACSTFSVYSTLYMDIGSVCTICTDSCSLYRLSPLSNKEKRAASKKSRTRR